MSKVVVVNNVTLDGVMQAPGRPDEDTRDGFAHGGWALPYNDAVMGRAMGEGMCPVWVAVIRAADLRRLLRRLAQPTDNPFTEVLNNAQKYVAQPR